MKTTAVLTYSSVLAFGIVLAGCGGGGGGGSGDTSAPAAAGGAIGGVAAKGLLSKATVTAYCGNSVATADKLTSGVTDSSGRYDIKWTTACAKPVKLVVTADASTTMLDEATGTNVAPSANFSLSALVADPSTTTTKHITPFTDMAVAIASTSATKEEISNAESAIVATVLGGDFNAYQAKPVPPTAAGLATASTDEKKLATLLTAVSALAQDDATCTAASTETGTRIACAMKKLTDQAKLTVTKVRKDGYDVVAAPAGGAPCNLLSATLAKVQDVTNSLGKGKKGTETEVYVAELKGSGADTLLATTLTSGTKTITSVSGIQAARDLFNSLKTDLAALSNDDGDGFLDKTLSDAKTDFSTNGQVSATGFIDFLAALNRATKMANEAKTATWPIPGTLQANAAYPVAGHSDLILLTNATGSALSFVRYFTSPDMSCRVSVSEMSLGKALCSFSYGKASDINASAGTSTSYFHGVRVTESTTSSGAYTWQDYFFSRVFSLTQRYITPGGAVFVPVSGQSILGPQSFIVQRSYTTFPVPQASPVDGTSLVGTATRTLDSTGNVTAVTLKGDIQPLATGQDKSTLDISAASSSTSTSQTVNLTGTLTNVKGTSSTLTMTLANGSQLVGPVATATTQAHADTANFVAQIKTAAFQYDGTLAMDTFTADKGGNYKPANSSFTGKISTLANGAATEFLNGTLGLKMTNLADFDPTKPTSSTNFIKDTASFTGTVTNGTSTYGLTLILDGSTFGQESVTLNYNRNGSQMVSITGTSAAGTTSLAIKGTGDVNIELTNGIGVVKTGTSSVGSVNKNQVNFDDGTYLLLGT